jgi:L-ascorbate metabolism protein UlaG (beta-lactamase superfamily)
MLPARLASCASVRFLAAMVAALALAGGASAAPTKVTWHGHAAFEIVTPKGAVLMIDPWLGNPLNPAAQGGKDAVAAVARLNYILLTHGHFDHVGDAVALAKRTGAKLIANFELGSQLVSRLGYPEAQADLDTLMNIGGEITVAGGEVKVTMVPAIHASGVDVPGDNGRKTDMVYGGNPCGFVLTVKDGPTIYHTGDTAYFSDMHLIGDEHKIDLVLVNIGGHFGMETFWAAKAAEASNAKLVVPMH